MPLSENEGEEDAAEETVDDMQLLGVGELEEEAVVQGENEDVVVLVEVVVGLTVTLTDDEEAGVMVRDTVADPERLRKGLLLCVDEKDGESETDSVAQLEPLPVGEAD